MLSINTHSVYNRRNVYNNGLWVDPQPDLTGRYRNCTPTFFRSNPAQVHRIEPWLNRELSALMSFSMVYMVHEQILDLLRIVPIQSSAFRSCLVPHLGANTDHFIHEFYNFVRSPFDMIGYDNCATYSRHRPPIFDLSDEDSDVLVVDSPSNNDCVYVPPRTPEIIVIESDDSDSDDVIIQEPIPPPIVDLLESDDLDLGSSNCNNNNTECVNNTAVEDPNRTESRSPQLPIKIRLKRNRSSVEIRKNYKRNERRNRKRDRRDDISNSDVSNNSELDDPMYSTSYDDSASTSSDSDYASSSNNRMSYSRSDRTKSSKRKKSNKYKKHNKNDSKLKNSKSMKYKIFKKLKVEEKSKDSKAKRSKKSKKQKKLKRHNENSCSFKVQRTKKIKLENSETSSSHSNNEYSSSSDEDADRKDHKKYRPRRTLYQIKYEIENKNLPCSDQEKSNLSAQDIPAASSSHSSPDNATDPPATSTNSAGTNCLSNSAPAPATAQYVPNEAGPSHVPSLRSVVNVIVKNKGGEFWCSSSSPAALTSQTATYRPDLRRRNSFDVVSDSD